MEFIKEKTNLILARASTNSEWDNCDYAIITLKNEIIARWKEVSIAYKALKIDFPELYISSLEVVFGESEFYKLDEDTPTTIEAFLEEHLDDEDDPTWSYVKDVPESLGKPENRLTCYSVTVDETQVRFTAIGKHTGEEFYTDWINLASL